MDSRDDSLGLVKPSGNADIEFMVAMETGPGGTTFVRFIPYSRGYVINAVPMSSLTSSLSLARVCAADGRRSAADIRRSILREDLFPL